MGFKRTHSLFLFCIDFSLISTIKMRSSEIIFLAFPGIVFSSPLGNARFWRRQASITASSACPSTSIVVQTNDIQASIIKQQEWNLCSFRLQQGLATGAYATSTCSSFGNGNMIPFSTTGLPPHETTTYIATYLTEYATLTSATEVISTDCTGALHTMSVGELGQGKFLSC